MSKQYNQQEFDSYMSSLLFAANASDIEHFENKVKQMLDTKASAVLSKLNEDEMKTFEELKTKLVNSSFNSESMYYEKEIDALIQNVSKRVS